MKNVLSRIAPTAPARPVTTIFLAKLYAMNFINNSEYSSSRKNAASTGPLALQTFSVDYIDLAAKYPEPTGTLDFFGGGVFSQKGFLTEQRLDFGALRGLLLSSSYSPPARDAKHQPMLAELKQIFEAHANGGYVTVEYETHLYHGRL
jgi:hypothetical protein